MQIALDFRRNKTGPRQCLLDEELMRDAGSGGYNRPMHDEAGPQPEEPIWQTGS